VTITVISSPQCSVLSKSDRHLLHLRNWPSPDFYYLRLQRVSAALYLYGLGDLCVLRDILNDFTAML
jgi:hypothetical protein